MALPRSVGPSTLSAFISQELPGANVRQVVDEIENQAGEDATVAIRRPEGAETAEAVFQRGSGEVQVVVEPLDASVQLSRGSGSYLYPGVAVRIRE